MTGSPVDSTRKNGGRVPDWRAYLRPADVARLRAALRGRRILLASGSPRRRALLDAAGMRYKVVAHGIAEDISTRGDPARQAKHWALAKARAAAHRVRSGLVLGVDTLVIMNDTIMGKPRDTADAGRMLRRLSGREHRVVSGVALVDAPSGRHVVGQKTTRVRFAPLSRGWIERYVATGAPLDKAGAYGIQDEMVAAVATAGEPIDNVIGLPTGAVASLIERLGK